MSQTTQTLYTAQQLQSILADVRGKRVPPRTLRWWRNSLGIEPGYCNTYDSIDLEILKSLVRWLNQGGTIDDFKHLLRQQINQGEFHAP